MNFSYWMQDALHSPGEVVSSEHDFVLHKNQVLDLLSLPWQSSR
ncbi:hypothetical protein LT85_1564 [Collimonas arenae]|uniref:Uncharacterized protein n=1 Tax=Collimonas arenae TaxID=279058 RepID=A0A0A1FD18_9BURK|nr:hypothetical protein LT85_1564 [Collimonas arenae]